MNIPPVTALIAEIPKIRTQIRAFALFVISVSSAKLKPANAPVNIMIKIKTVAIMDFFFMYLPS